ncbi:MAG: ABC transporter permease [Candidatus Micrarchaeota archaeon]
MTGNAEVGFRMNVMFMSELMGIYGVWLREVKVFFREKERIISSIITPLLWLAALGSGLGASVEFSGVNYQEFVFPGIIAMNVLFVSLFFGVYIIWDRKLDFLKEVLVAPVSRTSVFIGKMLGGVTDGAIQTGLLIIVATTLFGFKLSLFSAIATFLIAVYLGACLVSIGLIIGANLSSPEGFNLVMTFVMWPMFLFSGALFPTTNLPGWLGIVIKADPLFYGVDALRQVMVGTGQYPIMFDLLVIGIVTLAGIFVGAFSFKRMQV